MQSKRITKDHDCALQMVAITKTSTPLIRNGCQDLLEMNIGQEECEKLIGKEDCDALHRECGKVQEENLKYRGYILRNRKIIQRIKKEKRFLMKKLQDFADDYHSAKDKAVESEENRMSVALHLVDVELAAKEPKTSKKRLKVHSVKKLQNAPKKPTNAFLMFCQKNRDIVQEQYKKVNKAEINRQEMTRKLAEIWQKTPKEDRKAYYEMYEKDKARYAQEMKDFESKNSQDICTTDKASREQEP